MKTLVFDNRQWEVTRQALQLIVDMRASTDARIDAAIDLLETMNSIDAQAVAVADDCRVTISDPRPH